MSEDRQFTIHFGRRSFTLNIAAERIIPTHRETEPVAANDPGGEFRRAVESPTRFPALHLALTPDDHVAIVVDRWTVGEMAIRPILDQLHQGGVRDENVTFVGPACADDETQYLGLKKECHDSTNEQQHAYVATTEAGRRIYLNRTVVEADQIVVVSDTHYDVETGTSGGPLAIYPGLADEKSKAGWRTLTPADLRAQAEEIRWLVGNPFYVHTIPGPGDSVAHVIGGAADTYVDARKMLQSRWRLTVDRPANIVIAAIGADAESISSGDVVSAISRAARAVEPGGTIIVCFEGQPALSPSLASLCDYDSPESARRGLHRIAGDHSEAMRWLKAVGLARILILSDWKEEMVEDLHATALDHPKQVQRVIDQGGDVIILPDAHRVRAVVQPTGAQ